MKQTQETLRTLYLQDLQLPDTFHGRTAPKVRNLNAWKAIESVVAPMPKDQQPTGDTWVWSDNHFGHKNIIKYADGFRPYESVEEMNAVMITNCLKVVKPNDTLIFGGDVAFMAAVDMNEIPRQLPGYKIQIVGNHDMDRSGKLTNFHMHERHLCMIRDISDTKFQLLFTHYPMDNVPKNCVNVHGHIHQNLAYDHNINICVEHTGCAPINIKVIEARAIQYLTEEN
jgi:calcineurin-like phosphoesterase family protein